MLSETVLLYKSNTEVEGVDLYRIRLLSTA